MKTLLTLALALIPIASLCQTTARNSVAPTPPMGWNSWDSFAESISEGDVRKTAAVMAQELKRFGWQYVVIDEGWYVTNPLEQDPKKKTLSLTDDGRFIPVTDRFPSSQSNSGLKPLADYVHSLGLKLGIHILRGIPRQAVAQNTAIADSNYRARDAAEESDTCPWNNYNFGVKDNAAGQAYYDSILKLYAGWGIDFLKVDCISNNPYKPDEIRMISEAIKKTGRPIVLSLSPGPTSLEHADEVAKHAEMWRTCNDFWDHWGTWKGFEWSQSLLAQFAVTAAWAPHISPGHWPDSDMLPLGRLGPHAGAGEARDTRFTRDEQRTVMNLWSISRSPLIMGGNLLELDDWTRSLLTNADLIAVNQHSRNNRQVLNEDNAVIWAADPENGSGHYVAVFNIGDAEKTIDRTWDSVGLAAKKHRVRDLWDNKNSRSLNRLTVTLKPHASVMWRVE